MPLTAFALLVAAQIFDYASFLVMTARHGLGRRRWLGRAVLSVGVAAGLVGGISNVATF